MKPNSKENLQTTHIEVQESAAVYPITSIRTSIVESLCRLR